MTIRPEHTTTIPALGQVLGRAFDSDPLFVYIEPDDSERTRLLPALMTAALRHCGRYGGIETDGSGALGWTNPGRWEMSVLDVVRSRMVFVPIRYRRMWKRASPVFGEDERLHRELAPEPHLYFWVLGVDPAHWGQGRGRTLLQAGIDRADARGLAAYLETNTEKNVAFYQRNGFKIAAESTSSDGELLTWHMKRPAQQDHPHV